MSNHPNFIFFDKTGRRWMWCRFAIYVLASTGIFGGILFGLGFFVAPHTPPIQIHTAGLYRQDEYNEQLGAPGKLVKAPFSPTEEAPAMDHRPHLPTRSRRVSGEPPVIFGFYVPWNEQSFVSLKANSAHLTHVLAEWLILENGSGDLRDLTEPHVVEWSRMSHVPVLSIVTNFKDNEWRPKEIHRILAHPAARRHLVANIAASIRKHGLAGANLDLEQVPVADRDRLTALVRELRQALRSEGLLLTEDVPTDDVNVAAYDMRALAELNDYIIPMVYDEHYSAGSPGPAASLPWVRRQLQEVLNQLPAQKTVVGLGNYGYDWTIGSTRAAVDVSFADVLSRANLYHGTVEWHAGLMNPSVRYCKAGVQHEIWFLDAVTALNSVIEVHRRGFAGVSFWRLGAEDPGLWAVFQNRSWPSEKFPANALAALPPIENVRQLGRGEAIRVTQTRSPGWRRVWRDASGFSESFDRNPTGDVVGGIGSSGGKSVTLTFDDGPDPRYTARILDILKTKRVPATFFVVGRLAESSGDLLRRMYAEGHNIGNHTYTHANEVLASDTKLAIELNLTQRLIEHSVGRSTALFRSPYNADSDPRTPLAVESVLRPQRLGYLTVGERIDPRDWEGKTADEILEGVLRDRHLGSVILLHDGGGNREATVQALPAIIDALRAQGYRFLALQELLGRSRNELMPPVDFSESIWATVQGGLLSARAQVMLAVRGLFIAAIVLTLLRTLVYGALAIAQKRRAAKRCFDPCFQPPISVILAAHNEAKVIGQAVSALLASDFPDFEVIVVDDGSTDTTFDVLWSEFSADRRVRILSQPNLGKAAALNRAIGEAACDLVVALDADTLFTPSTIKNLVRHFSDPRVAAVSGNAKVGNPVTWIARLQSLEYVCGFNLDRRALDVLNAAIVVPGAVGAWRKSAILEAGGYPADTVAEDADLTLAIRRRGYLIRYDEDAIAYTEVPETLLSLVRQRLRWAFGTLQSAWKHRDTTLRARYGTMGLVTMPSIWLYQIMFASVSPFAEIALLVALLSGELRVVLVYYLVFFAAEMVAGLLAYILEGENPLNLSLLPLQRILYPRLMLYVVCKSLLYAVGGRSISWGVHVRKASARIAPRAVESEYAEQG
jgi:cellulose synthase/poly-beta-1,6-N-acetylglucosamine synthase-like glycosyltransferase/spore germination protein YaaH/peptidoglycan/xylan/chitin deacetylase (PgdA/CDA1 family)